MMRAIPQEEARMREEVATLSVPQLLFVEGEHIKGVKNACMVSLSLSLMCCSIAQEASGQKCNNEDVIRATVLNTHRHTAHSKVSSSFPLLLLLLRVFKLYNNLFVF